MTELYNLSDLEVLASDCLTRVGMERPAAAIVARSVSQAEASGDDENGFAGLLRDLELIRFGRLRIDADVQVQPLATCVTDVDAGHGFAATALDQALVHLAKTAADHGMAMLRLRRASEPGSMAGAMGILAEHGLAGVSLRHRGGAYAIRPGSARVAPISSEDGTSILSALLALAPAPADTPFDGPVNHSGWLMAMEPTVTGISDLMDNLPREEPNRAVGEIALAPDLLARIVNA